MKKTITFCLIAYSQLVLAQKHASQPRKEFSTVAKATVIQGAQVAPQGLISSSNVNPDTSMQIVWRMYDRFVHHYKNGSAVGGYNSITHQYDPEFVNPHGWDVELFIKKQSGSNTRLGVASFTYTWTIDGITDDKGNRLNYHYSIKTSKDGLEAILAPGAQTVGELPVERTISTQGQGPSTSVVPQYTFENVPQFPSLGLYKISITKARNDGTVRSTTIIETKEMFVTLRDILIVCIGDSFASGEGNPDNSGVSSRSATVLCDDATRVDYAREGAHYEVTHDMDLNPTWYEPLAHRSLKSAPALAALALEKSDPHSTVTFITVATSGAEITDGLYRHQLAFQDTGQIDEVKRIVANRKIDYLIMSIGVNDLGYPGGFSDIIGSLATPTITENDEQQENHMIITARENVGKTLSNYRTLNTRIRSTLRVDSIILMQIPANILMDRNSNPIAGCFFLSGIDHTESVVLSRIAEDFLAYQQQACLLNHWIYLDGVFGAFAGHNYCSDDCYYVFASQSCDQQGNFMGSLHPNIEGTQVVADLLYKKIQSALSQVRLAGIEK